MMKRRQLLLGSACLLGTTTGCLSVVKDGVWESEAEETAETETQTPQTTRSATPASMGETMTPSSTIESVTDTGTSISLSDRETYTSPTYGYTVDYPRGWRRSSDSADTVMFNGDSGREMVLVVTDVNESASIETLADGVLYGYRSRVENAGWSIEIGDRERTTFGDGLPAMELRATLSGKGQSLYDTILLVKDGTVLYAVAVGIEESLVTDARLDDMRELRESLRLTRTDSRAV